MSRLSLSSFFWATKPKSPPLVPVKQEPEEPSGIPETIGSPPPSNEKQSPPISSPKPSADEDEFDRSFGLVRLYDEESIIIKEEEEDPLVLYDDDDNVDYDNNEDSALAEVELQQQMVEEKKLFPEASTWAPDEEKLFEILFLRAYRPLLPYHWELDFRGVPMPGLVYSTSDEDPPIVYAHKKQFAASTALMRMVDLTADIRTCKQSSQRRKVPNMMKRSFDAYLAWAAEDGGYKNLRVVPNVIVELISLDLDAEVITEYMKRRMRAVAELQREFWKVDRDPDFWDTTMPQLIDSKNLLASMRAQSVESRRASRKRSASAAGLSENGAAVDSPERRTEQAETDSPKKRRLDEQLTADEYLQLQLSSEVDYRRQPPVVYGLFILNSLVFFLTVDPAKGEDCPVSFHVQLDFEDRHQSVWNALTVAIVTCLARDDMMTRIDSFDELPAEADSDPDA
ncbi:hypothetical protein B0I35DRAFT_430139 [Stachybotrys elegans]|uniref:Uncharacterized protein n=1 Tax=Stachybotrys elegans TaxID=80388 RepID=A0A8K0SQF4_9HYPO|nr:hypothetical protein B0I35DRAFT_430139 [Stachybotrys elegans]